jgi:hypothetical protein
MACRYFEEGRVTRCCAVEGTLVPSLHERERYCRGDEHACPTLRLFHARGQGPLPEEVYYRLWGASAPGAQSTGERAEAVAHEVTGVT